MQRQTVAADKYVQAPISRLPSGDLSSSGMSFMQGGAAMTGGALGSDPATWSPVSKGGRMSLAGMRKRGDLDKFGVTAKGGRMSLADMRKRGDLDKFGVRSGLAGQRKGSRGAGACGGGRCRKGQCCMGRGLYA